jgi:hypothetical protein
MEEMEEVVKDRKDLYCKIELLIDKIDARVYNNSMPTIDFNDLCLQRDIMTSYLSCLDNRIHKLQGL